MRNPMNSWDKSDSEFEFDTYDRELEIVRSEPCLYIGDNDLKLMRSLAKAGDDHGKFLRMINVTADITAPLYWWKEYDTYKVGAVANSCSTMHKIHEKEFTLDDFSHEKLLDYLGEKVITKFKHVRGYVNTPLDDLDYDIEKLNMYRDLFLETNDKVWWEQMIQRLPSSYNQKRTVQLNYQVLAHMYFARKNHKLDEWHEFCAWVESLPYFREIVLQEA